MRKFYCLLTGILLFCCIAASAQTTVTGKVADSQNGNPLAGATINAQGTSVSVKAAEDGSFSIPVPAGAKNLVVTNVGYKRIVFPINGTTLSINLDKDDSFIDEVVVTGYKNASKREFTGAATTVAGEKLRSTPIASLDQLLQGRAAGVSIRAASGQPGSSGSTLIRGRGSINSATEPIYVVDGMQISSGDFALLNPNDVENISILKDAVAASIYGSRGANGVIVVTTKKGSNNKTRIEVDSYLGYSRMPKFRDFKLMNSAQKREYEERRFDQLGLGPITYAEYDGYSAAEVDSIFSNDNDWEEILTRTSVTQSLNLSASGGNDKTKFFVSGNYFNQGGTFIGTEFDRYTGRLNLTHNVGNGLSFGVNSTFTFSNFTNTPEATTSIGAPLNALQWTNPFESPFQTGPDGLPFRPATTITGQPIGSTVVFYNTNHNKQMRGIGSVYGQYQLPWIKGLSAKVLFGMDYNQDDQDAYTDRRTSAGATRQGAYSQAFGWTRRFTNTNSINYGNTFGDHMIDAGVYYEFLDVKSSGFNYTGYGLTGALQNVAGITVAPTATLLPGIGGSAAQARLESWFGNLTYGFKGRYFITGNVRQDASSRFGAANRKGIFGGAGVSWVVLDEPFMANLQNVFSSLKLKASYGTLGNQEGIGAYQSLETYGARTYNAVIGIGQTQLANPDLQWESRKKFNAGIEFGLFRNRINGEANFYRETTDNLFFPDPISLTTGFSSLTRNVGSVRNTGVEFSLSADVIATNSFRLNLFGNITYNKNEIVKLSSIGGDSIENAAGDNIYVIGKPITSLYSVKYVGVDPTTGEAIYENPDGTTTNTFSAENRQIVGKSDAPLFGGFGLNADYKGLALGVTFNYFFGSKAINNERANLENPDYFVDNLNSDLINEWQKPGDVSNIPSALATFEYGTTRFIEDNSFIRLRNVSLSYTLPRSLVTKARLQGITAYVTGTNLWVSTKYRGRDPEFPMTTALGAQYPALKTVTAGIRVTL